MYCSITGFGAGAGAALPGYDLLVQALGGLMSITGEADAEPQKAGVALVDVITGLFAAVGVLAAVRHRDRTGEGQRVEVDLLSSLLAALVNQGSAYTLAGAVAGRMGNAHPSIAPYELFPTADGDLVLAVGNDKQFAALCATIGRRSGPRRALRHQRRAGRASRGAARRAGRAPGGTRRGRLGLALSAVGVPPGRSTTSPALRARRDARARSDRRAPPAPTAASRG